MPDEKACQALASAVQDITKDHIALFDAGAVIDKVMHRLVIDNLPIYPIRDAALTEELHRALNAISERLGGCAWRMESEAAK